MATENNLGCWVPITLAAIVWFFLPASWFWHLWYSVEYSVATDQVDWKAKPSDCDWGRAPLGEKGCHYEKTVTAFNAAGDVVGGEDAPTYGTDAQTGKPTISYDKGKTWAWAHTAPDLTVKRVQIGWVKMTD
jgi:hypothetical protein